MGTSTKVPVWVGEIQIQEQTGWTDRQLYEEVSLGTIQKMNYLNEMRSRAEAIRGRSGKRVQGIGRLHEDGESIDAN